VTAQLYLDSAATSAGVWHATGQGLQSGFLYALVATLTGTTIAFGTAVTLTLKTPNGLAAVVTLTQGNSYLVAYNVSAGAYAMQLAVSGTTANWRGSGPATSGAPTNWIARRPLFVISSAQAFGVAGTVCRAMSISGGAVTMSAAAAATMAATSVLMLSTPPFVFNEGGALQAFSVTGTTTTAGTQLSAQCLNTTIANMFAVSATSFMVVGNNTWHHFTVSGTTITAAAGIVLRSLAAPASTARHDRMAVAVASGWGAWVCHAAGWQKSDIFVVLAWLGNLSISSVVNRLVV
jgi:hypothetical protein